MAKYLVELRRRVEFDAYVEVEAESETLAQDKAYHMWEQDCDNTRFEWDEIEENCRVYSSERLHEEEAKP
jgi:hypothetical protein